MATFLRSSWLSAIAKSELDNALDELETYVSGTHLTRNHLSMSPDGLSIALKKQQPVQIISDVEVDEDGNFHTIISDGFSFIHANFTEKCVEDFKTQYERNLTSIKGGILTLTGYQLVVQIEQTISERLIVLISNFKLLGSEGSDTFGRPRDLLSAKVQGLCARVTGYLLPSVRTLAGFSMTQYTQQNDFLATQDHKNVASQNQFTTQVPDAFQRPSSMLENEGDADATEFNDKEQNTLFVSPSASEQGNETGRPTPSPEPDEVMLSPKPATVVSAQIREEEAADESLVRIDATSQPSGGLPFVDIFQHQNPFQFCKRVLRKFARISKDQREILHSGSWYNQNDRNQMATKAIPKRVKESLAQHASRLRYDSDKKEEEEAEDESEEDNESVSDVVETMHEAVASPCPIHEPVIVPSPDWTDEEAEEDQAGSDIVSESESLLDVVEKVNETVVYQQKILPPFIEPSPDWTEEEEDEEEERGDQASSEIMSESESVLEIVEKVDEVAVPQSPFVIPSPFLPSSPEWYGEKEHSDDGYETDRSIESEQVLPPQPETRRVDLSGNEKKPIELSSDDSSEEASQHESGNVTTNEVELDMPVVTGGFSSDVELENEIVAAQNVEDQESDTGVPSTAVGSKPTVQVERTPYVPVSRPVATRRITGQYISSDPVIPATNSVIAEHLIHQHEHEILPSSPPAVDQFLDGEHDGEPSSVAQPLDYADIVHVIPQQDDAVRGVTDSSPLRMFSEDSQPQICEDVQAYRAESAGPLLNNFNTATEPSERAGSVPANLSGPLSSVGQPCKQPKPASKSKKSRPRFDSDWKKYIARRISKENDHGAVDTKSMVKEHRRKFRREQSLENEEKFINIAGDPELTALTSLSEQDEVTENSAPAQEVSHQDVSSTCVVDSNEPASQELEHALTPAFSDAVYTIALSTADLASASENMTFMDNALAESAGENLRNTLEESTQDIEPQESTIIENDQPWSQQELSYGGALDHSSLDNRPSQQLAQDDSQLHLEIKVEIDNNTEDIHESQSPSTPDPSFARSHGDSEEHHIKTEKDHLTVVSQPLEKPNSSEVGEGEEMLSQYSQDIQVQETQFLDAVPQTAISEDSISMSVVSSSNIPGESTQMDDRAEQAMESTVISACYFTRFCVEYPEYTGDQSDFTLALVYIEYLLANSMFGHSHMCDDFIRFYPGDYLALHGDKLKISGWELFKKKVRRPEFESDIISAENIEEALESLDLTEVIRMRSKFAGQERHLVHQSRRSSTARRTPASPDLGLSIPTAHTPVMIEDQPALVAEDGPAVNRVEQEVADTASPKEAPRQAVSPDIDPTDNREEQEEQEVAPRVSAQKARPNRQPFFETASQQPQKRKLSTEVISATPKKRRILPWTPKQSTPRQWTTTGQHFSPPAQVSDQASPILGDPNFNPRLPHSAAPKARIANPFSDVSKGKEANRRRTLATETLMENPHRSASASSNRSKTDFKTRAAIRALACEPDLFKKIQATSRRNSIMSHASLTPGSSAGGRSISRKLESDLSKKE